MPSQSRLNLIKDWISVYYLCLHCCCWRTELYPPAVRAGSCHWAAMMPLWRGPKREILPGGWTCSPCPETSLAFLPEEALQRSAWRVTTCCHCETTPAWTPHRCRIQTDPPSHLQMDGASWKPQGRSHSWGRQRAWSPPWPCTWCHPIWYWGCLSWWIEPHQTWTCPLHPYGCRF